MLFPSGCVWLWDVRVSFFAAEGAPACHKHPTCCGKLLRTSVPDVVSPVGCVGVLCPAV